MHRSVVLVLSLTACSKGSLHIGYDPIGTWSAIAEEDWPPGEDFAADSRACSDDIRGILGLDLELDGSFPEWKAEKTDGSAIFGNLVIPVAYSHDISGGAAARPQDPEFVFEDGSLLHYLDLYTGHLLRVNTEAPGTNYCWTWFEQD